MTFSMSIIASTQAARPTSSARAEEVHGTYGNVKVIDLFSNDPSSTSHGHRHHQPILHFKSSSDPLTFLSFNPSSSLLLTSSIEGHSFHVFELRPHSRVGKSYLNSCRPNHPSLSSREATVWHRYKLTRGFTSAEVTDVVWRWDSKIVSVLTEHGTHRMFFFFLSSDVFCSHSFVTLLKTLFGVRFICYSSSGRSPNHQYW
jgi:hypothetical protein